MSLRPEFELLNRYFKQLYADVAIDQEFLRRVKDHIDLCEHIVEGSEEDKTTEYGKEKTIIGSAKYWWKVRADKFAMMLLSATVDEKKYDFTEEDLRFMDKISAPEKPKG